MMFVVGSQAWETTIASSLAAVVCAPPAAPVLNDIATAVAIARKKVSILKAIVAPRLDLSKIQTDFNRYSSGKPASMVTRSMNSNFTAREPVVDGLEEVLMGNTHRVEPTIDLAFPK